MSFLREVEEVERIGYNTPVFKLKHPCQNLFAKLEYTNFIGSIKDRPALYMLKNAIKNKRIDETSTVIESTSGNFGIALAVLCKRLGIKFIPIIDPNITREKEMILESICHKVIKVTDRDRSGGYLLNRLLTVENTMKAIPHSFNLNQYKNEDNYLCYYHTLAEELCNSFSRLDFAFVSVSTGGTITGLSLRLKEKFKNIKIVAVDVEGSLVFDNSPRIRHISGMGSSVRSGIIEHAMIDEIVILPELEIVEGSRKLLNEQAIFAGASSGAAYFAALRMLGRLEHKNLNAVIICPDRGSAYLDNIYNDKWVDKHILKRENSFTG
jgi:N-(2-amino-2-carboxyethyl)-L-glutamate synthase